MYYLSIVCARKSIFIANPYFVPDEAAVEALLEAKKRGVDVRIMVSGIHNDNWFARLNGVRLYGPLLEAGIEILEFNRTMLHQKTMVVDARWATVGTTNFDYRSFAHNEEIQRVRLSTRAWGQGACTTSSSTTSQDAGRVTLDGQWRNPRRRPEGDRDLRRRSVQEQDLGWQAPGAEGPAPAVVERGVTQACAWSPGDTRTAARSRPAAT
jgi:hypothetical protein